MQLGKYGAADRGDGSFGSSEVGQKNRPHGLSTVFNKGFLRLKENVLKEKILIRGNCHDYIKRSK